MKIGLFAALSLLVPCSTGMLPALPAAAENAGEGAVQWLSWEDAMRRHQAGGRKIFLSIYTDWCGWCKRMDAQTYSHPKIASYLNAHFLPVKLDAEYRQALTYRGETYDFVKKGERGYHALAAELLRGRLSYPSVVFFDEEGEVIQAIVGFKTPEQFEQILTYFAGNHYKHTPWGVYARNYEPFLISDE